MFTQKGALVNLKNGAQLLLTLNEHNCFITLIFLKHFSTPRNDCYIFLTYSTQTRYEDGMRNLSGYPLIYPMGIP